jgi:hypothetical protein
LGTAEFDAFQRMLPEIEAELERSESSCLMMCTTLAVAFSFARHTHSRTLHGGTHNHNATLCCPANRMVELSTVHAVVASLTRDDADLMSKGIEVVPAFSTHKWRFDAARGIAHYVGSRFPLHAEAGARVAMLEERLTTARWRTLRNEYFRPAAPGRDAVSNKLYRVDELPALMAECGLGQATKEVVVFGMLTQPEEGLWCLEDSERSVALYLDSPEAVQRKPGYYTETSCVLINGVYEPEFFGEVEAAAGAGGAPRPSKQPPQPQPQPQPQQQQQQQPPTAPSRGTRSTTLTDGRLPGALRVQAIVHPFPEPRKDTLRAMGVQDTFKSILTPMDFDRELQLEEDVGAHKMFVALSDCHGDSPAVLSDLRKMLQGFSDSGSIPALFILMGNFTQRPFGASLGGFSPAAAAAQAAGGARGSGSGASQRSAAAAASSLHNATSPAQSFSCAMEALGALLASFPTVCQQTHFVLVPGPGDPGSAPVLPRPPLPTALCAPHLVQVSGEPLSAIPNLTLATNPCRLRFYTREIVVFRGEPSMRLARASMLPPEPVGPEAPPSFHTACTQVWQGHLLPLSLHSQPLYWEHDHALRTSPSPHAIILGEDHKFWAHEVEDTLVFNTGSFAGDTSFAVYRPVQHCVEESSVAVAEDEEEEEGEEEEEVEEEEEEEGGVEGEEGGDGRDGREGELEGELEELGEQEGERGEGEEVRGRGQGGAASQEGGGEEGGMSEDKANTGEG